MRIFIVFGGPSIERAISLNSARSLADHLHAFDVTQSWVFVSQQKTFHFIDKTWLYCNTIEDFEFKITQGFSWEEFCSRCDDDDVVFSLIHGDFGEDGEFSSWLEQAGLCFIGPRSESCTQAYLKENGLSVIDELGFAPGPYLCVKSKEQQNELSRFLKSQPPGKKFFMKPNAGGSSLGARSFTTEREFWEQFLAHPRYYSKGAIVEPFYDEAEEFCTTIFSSGELGAEIYSLAPVSIGYASGEFYDYRKKYMLSDHSQWECPAQWPQHYHRGIQEAAKKLYRRINARGLVRVDGWVFPGGRIAFSDINLISGFEQNSLLFRQAAICGLSHQGLCRWLIENVAQKTLPLPQPVPLAQKSPVSIVFGGESSEKQTSMLSGINVWLKLISQNHLDVVPYLWDSTYGLRVVPYHAMLSHGLAGLMAAMLIPQTALSPYRLPFADLPEYWQRESQSSLSISSFINQEKRRKSFVFLALHGGDGENGVWQSWLVQAGIPFNGSGPQASAIGMDKQQTAKIINKMNHPKIQALDKCVFELSEELGAVIHRASNFHQNNPFPWVLKPRSEGCSSGVMLLNKLSDLSIFIARLQQKPGAGQQLFSSDFEEQWPKTENCVGVTSWMIEPMIICDKVQIGADQKVRTEGSGWVELTQGVMQVAGEWEALPASLVVAENSILTLEEKFQGGTGTNLTPVPFFAPEDHWWLSRAMIQAAEVLGIEHYARFDLFYHRERRDIIIIEVNTLPGLTASTVLFHQLILKGLTPQKFFAWLVDARNQPARRTEDNAVVLS